MILLDTETTGLLRPMTAPLAQQPEIIELGAIKLDDATLTEMARLQLLIRPRVYPLSPETVKATGITSEALKDCLTFARHVTALQEFFLGERVVVAHNCRFDMDIMAIELTRLAMMAKFPWPLTHACTVELSMDLEVPRARSDRLKLGDLYRYVTGQEQPVKHRAVEDAEALIPIVRWMRAKDQRV